jgi:WD40 repeat protein
MIRVCDAIQHAHTKGVIHRDLKPANILVESEIGPASDGASAGATPASLGAAALDRIGQPKILDFGVARLGPGRGGGVNVTTLRTSVGQLIGTLPYMSPEQVQGDPKEVDTRADVYALGVMLYELLAEKLPHDVANRPFADAVRTIVESRPAALSTISKVFRGELDTIVQKAMDKDKQRRYQSAAEFGADLARYLAGEPISAKRDSALYVIRKQLKRYRHVVAACVAAAALVVAFAVFATMQWRSNQHLAADLARELTVSRGLSEQLQEELSQANIERGRLITITGDAAGGERLIWAEMLRRPDSRFARWALREYYSRYPRLRALPVAGGSPTGLAYSAPAGLVAFIGRNRTVEVWDDRFKTRIAGFTAHDNWLGDLAFSPDGATLATADRAGSVRLWDPRSGTMLRELASAGEAVDALAFSPDGAVLCTGGAAPSLTFWDLATGKPSQLAPLPGAVSQVAFSPDGAMLAVAARAASVPVFSPASRLMLHQIDTTMSAVSAVAFTHGGDSLIIGGVQGEIGLWQVNGWQRTMLVTTNGSWISSLTPSENGASMAVSGRGVIEIRALPDLSSRTVLSRERSVGHTVVLRPDGRAVYCAGADGVVGLWEPESGTGQRILERRKDWVFTAVPSPDGRLLATSGTGDTLVVDRASDGERITTLEMGGGGRARMIRFSPDGGLLAAGTASGRVHLFNVEGWRAWRPLAVSRQGIAAISFSPDGLRLAVGNTAGEVSLWRIPVSSSASADTQPTTPTLPELTLLRRQIVCAGRIEGLIYSPDGSRLYIAGADPILQSLDPATGLVLASVPGRGQSLDLALSPDGKSVLLVAFESAAELRSARTLEGTRLLIGHGGPVISAAFSPDSSLAATGSSDSSIRIWDVATGRCLATLDGHVGEVSSLAFFPDGRWMSSAGQDGTARIWDLEYFDRHIAGNLHYQIERLRTAPGAVSTPLDTAALEQWARPILDSLDLP